MLERSAESLRARAVPSTRFPAGGCGVTRAGARVHRNVQFAIVGLTLATAPQAPAVQAAQTLLRPPQAEIDRAIERGTVFLRETWEAEHGTDRPGGARVASRSGERALVGYTLLKAGRSHDDPAVQQIVAGLAFEEIDQTYDVACTLLLLEAQDARAHRAWIAELAGKLLEWQHDVGWGYPSGGDLSNTQYGALGLWAASRAGVAIPPEAWRRLSSAVARYGTKRGGFTYASDVDGGATGSMTAAGIGTLALCEMQLALAGTLEPAEEWSLQEERGRALEWLAGVFSVTTNPGGGWTHYWLYGLERMAAFGGLERIGGRDWYGEGAGWLVATQGERGAWGGERVTTCFAVLFLARAALASLAPSTGGATEDHCRSEPESNVRFEVRPVGERASFRLLGVRRPVAEALEWKGEARRGPRVLRVEYLAGDALVAVALGDASLPLLGRAFPASARVPAGTTGFRARVIALVPPGRPGSERATRESPAVIALESPVVRCDAAFGGPLLASTGAARANLLRGASVRVKAKASSTWGGFDDLPGVDFFAERALDGRPRRAWLADAGDPRPTLQLDLREPVRADTLYVSAAQLPGYPRDELGRALELQVTVDGQLVLLAPMPPNPERAARIVLGGPRALESLELCIVSSVPGRRGPIVGLGEVELALERAD